MDSIVPADIKSRPDGTKETKEAKQKSQDDFELTNSLDLQTHEEEYLMDRDNFSDLKKKKQIVSFSRIHKEVYELANSKQSISEGITHALNVIEESLRRYGYDSIDLKIISLSHFSIFHL
jgi:hypothetical protein